METHLLEYRILSLLRNRDAYLKYSNIIKPAMFESREAQYIHKLILFYHSNAKAKKQAPLSALYALVNTRTKSNESHKYKDIIGKIKKHPLEDESIADNIVKTFAQRQILKMTILDAVNSLDKEEKIDIARLRGRLDEALMIDSADLLDEAYNYYNNPAKRFQEEAVLLRVRTGLHSNIDKALKGGLAVGDIAVIVAPTSVGKTMFLINIAYNAMKEGKKVVYVSLELSGRRIASRFDQLVSKKTYEELIRHPELVYVATKRLKKLGGGLMIKDHTSGKLSSNELGVYLERLRKDFEFDMVIVDQMDLMYSPKEYKERRHELSSILISLRRLGSSFNIPIWTASQATRAAGSTGNTTLWDIAEDIGKANWADVILTLSQSPEDKEEKIMFLEIVKNRIGEGNPRVVLDVNYGHMLLRGQSK